MLKNNNKTSLNTVTILDCTVSPTAINHDFEKVFFPEIKEISEADDIDPAFWQSLCPQDEFSMPAFDSDPIFLQQPDPQDEAITSFVTISHNDDWLALLIDDEPVIDANPLNVTVTDLDDLDFRAFLKIKFAHELAYLRQPVASIDDGLSSQNESQGPAKRHKITKDLDLGSTLINHLW